jgi:hypothetical protein
LNTRQLNIVSTDDLTCNSITVSKTTPIENNELTSKIYVDNMLDEKQDIIVSSDDLTCNSNTVSKTAPIENDKLTSKIYVDNGLSEKQDIIVPTADLTCNSITVSKTTPIENNELTSKIYVDDGLAEKQDIIVSSDDLTCNSFTVSKTTPIENDELTSKIYVDNGLAEKQELINSSTNLICNSLTINHLEVDNSISTSQFFDTFVVRRPTGVSGVGSDRIGVKELQCWVNGVNIMIDNGLTSYFTSWLDKEVAIASQNVSTPSTNAYNNIINDLGALSSSSVGINSALLIKNIPYTIIHNIQALVFYSRDTNDTLQTAVGLGIEFYNSTNDPTYTTPLASTPVITTTVYWSIVMTFLP